MPDSRPNILCICMDQLRWDHLGCYGNPAVRTPNLDRLAAGGMVFDNAYVSNPLCMPARATLATGRTPRGHGVRTNGIPLDAGIPTMPEALRQAGYHTHAVGKLHLSNFGAPEPAGPDTLDLARWPESRKAWSEGVLTALPSPYYGFESTVFVGGHAEYAYGEYANWLAAEHPEMMPRLRGREKLEDWTDKCGEKAFKSALPEELHYNRYIADRTCEFLAEEARDGRPFFCWTSFPDPHHAYVAPRPYCDWYDPADMALPTRREGELESLPPFYRTVHDEGAARWRALSGRSAATRKTDDELRHIRAMTYAMVSCTDAAIGRVLDTLDEVGLADDTVVVFLADHGDMLGDHYIVNKGPFHFDGLLRMPLIWRWPGRVEAGARTAGLVSQIDFVPTVLELCGLDAPEGAGPPAPEAPMQREALPGRSLVAQLEGTREKVRDRVVIENDEDYLGTCLRTLITERYKITVYGGHPDWGELFDRESDPGELHNLWDAPAAQPIRQRLLVELLYAYLSEQTPMPRRMSHA